jgi:hypothetical protein
MNATELLKTVPLGAIVAFSDGTPRPPERFTKKLSAWKNKNGFGLLTEKSAGDVMASSDYVGRASFALRVAEYGSTDLIVMRVNMIMDETSELDFTVVELPTGTVRVNDRGHLVPPQDIAERARRGYDDPQRGERDEPAGYGAGYPSPIQPGDEPVLDLPGVKTFIRHKSLLGTSSASLLVQRDDGYTVRFPGTFCNTIVATLDGMLDQSARPFLLSLLKRREDGQVLTDADIRCR